MNLSEFKKQTEEFLSLSNYLYQRAKDTIPHAIEILSDPLPKDDVEPQQMCELQIRKVGSLLQALCIIHNKTYQSIDMQPIFPDHHEE